jgi:SAM-dependent methyltransferase
MTVTNPIYDPDQYWEARGGESYRLYTDSPEYRRYREAQFAFFRELIAELKPERLLDFGCGSGKLFPLWTAVPEVHAYDRARSQIEIARAEAARVRPGHPYQIMHCLAGERAETPYDDDLFDLIVAAEVLLHVVPADADALVAELRRICRGRLALVVPAPFDNPAPHCFDHDDVTLFENRFAITGDRCLHNQRYLTARKIPADQAQHSMSQAKEAVHAVVSP